MSETVKVVIVESIDPYPWDYPEWYLVKESEVDGYSPEEIFEISKEKADEWVRVEKMHEVMRNEIQEVFGERKRQNE